MFSTGVGTRIRSWADESVTGYFDFNVSMVRIGLQTEVRGNTHDDADETHPGFGAGFGAAFRVSPRLEVPLGVRYDHVFLRDDIGLLGLEAGLAISL